MGNFDVRDQTSLSLSFPTPASACAEEMESPKRASETCGELAVIDESRGQVLQVVQKEPFFQKRGMARRFDAQVLSESRIPFSNHGWPVTARWTGENFNGLSL